MLVITRKLSERIQIGDDIEIVIVELRPDRVRIGIDAPKDVHITRPEAHGEWPDREKETE